MAIFSSLLLGTEGSSKIFGVDVRFIKREDHPPVYFSFLPPFLDRITDSLKLINRVMGNVLFHDPFHLFVHEMGHALAAKLMYTCRDLEIRVFQNSYGQGAARTLRNRNLEEVTDLRETVVQFSGPMASMVFSSAKLWIAHRFFYFSPLIASFLATGAFCSIVHEIPEIFADITGRGRGIISESGFDIGDFARIAQRNKKYLAIATATLIAPLAAGIMDSPNFSFTLSAVLSSLGVAFSEAFFPEISNITSIASFQLFKRFYQ